MFAQVERGFSQCFDTFCSCLRSRAMVLTPAEAGWDAGLRILSRSCDWGYRMPPALRAWQDNEIAEADP